MRTALLSMIEPAGNGRYSPIAMLRVGGKTLARHQFSAALLLECERIVCLARAMEPEIIALQHDAEAAGLQFHVIAGPRDLAGYVTAADELIVFTEGLLAAPAEVAALLGPGQAVLTLPVESGLKAGFERIDLNNASAGLIRIPGRLADGLYDLPADCDVPSALTRIALQSGVPTREVATSARAGARWRMISSETQAYALEAEWLSEQLPSTSRASPGQFLAHLAVLALGTSLLHAGGASRGAAIGSGVLAGIALLTGWLGLPVAGFIFCALAWLLLLIGSLLRAVERSGVAKESALFPVFQVLGMILDGVLALLVLWTATRMPWDRPSEHLFAPVMLILTLRLVGPLTSGSWLGWSADRLLVGLFLALAAAFGFAAEAVRVLVIVLALVALALARGNSRLTQA